MFEKATRILSEVTSDKAFRTHHGTEIRDLSGLYAELKEKGIDFFCNHVNENKNDFANWIRDVLGDHELAFEMYQTKNFVHTINMIEQRVSVLQSQARLSCIQLADNLVSNCLYAEDWIKMPENINIYDTNPMMSFLKEASIIKRRIKRPIPAIGHSGKPGIKII